MCSDIVYHYYHIRDLNEIKKPVRDSVEELVKQHRTGGFKITFLKREIPDSYILFGLNENDKAVSIMRMFPITAEYRKRLNYKFANSAYINLVIVDKDYRNKGFGIDLFDHAKKLAKKLKFKRLILEVIVTNEPAMKLYTRVGFRFYSTVYWGTQALYVLDYKL